MLPMLYLSRLDAEVQASLVIICSEILKDHGEGLINPGSKNFVVNNLQNTIIKTIRTERVIHGFQVFVCREKKSADSLADFALQKDSASGNSRAILVASCSMRSIFR